MMNLGNIEPFLATSLNPITLSTANWSGFQLNPQMWDWGMQGTWYESYGPYDGLPSYVSPTYLWHWNIRSGQNTPYIHLRDGGNNLYDGYWAWPIPDPRWDGTHPNEIIATYYDTDQDIPGLMYRLRKLSDGTLRVITPSITGYNVGTQYSGDVAVWWNKPD